jgi:hypothetical protein
MYTNDEIASLGNLAKGGVIELFDLELEKALRNIDDPNKVKDSEREIVLTVKLKPTDTKGIVSIKIGIKSKLAGQRIINTALMIGRGPNGMEARELYQQQPLFNDNKVIRIPGKEDEE